MDRLMLAELRRSRVLEEDEDKGNEITADVYKYYCPFDCEITTWEKEKHEQMKKDGKL